MLAWGAINAAIFCTIYAGVMSARRFTWNAADGGVVAWGVTWVLWQVLFVFLGFSAGDSSGGDAALLIFIVIPSLITAGLVACARRSAVAAAIIVAGGVVAFLTSRGDIIGVLLGNALWHLGVLVAVAVARRPIDSGRPAWECVECRYDLRGLAQGTRCPECGVGRA